MPWPVAMLWLDPDVVNFALLIFSLRLESCTACTAEIITNITNTATMRMFLFIVSSLLK